MTEYMIYGYWYQEPSTPASGDIHLRLVFRDFCRPTGVTVDLSRPVLARSTTTVRQSACTSRKDPNAAVDTYRHGEFTADVVLEATSLRQPSAAP